METIPEPMTTAHDAGGTASSNCFTRGVPGTGDGPVGPSRLRLTALVCRDSRFMIVAPVATFRRPVPLDDVGQTRFVPAVGCLASTRTGLRLSGHRCGPR